MCTAHGKILAGKKLANLENYELFAKIFLANIPKMYLAYAPTVTYSPNFSLANSSYLYDSPKSPPTKIFLCTVLNTSKSTCILLNYFSQNNAMYLYLYFTKCQSTCTLLKYFHMYFAPCQPMSNDSIIFNI